MKHLLPILTLSLFGVAVTASADPAFDNFYYDYYKNPTVSGVSPLETASGTRETDKITYQHDFAITRVSQANNGLLSPDGSNKTHLFLINITGGDLETGKQVKLYLTDFVATLNGADTSNALYTNVATYGYRILNADGTVKAEKYMDMPTASELQESDVIDGGELNKNNPPAYRYKYELGSFDHGDQVELYMEHRTSGYYAYSYSGLSEEGGLSDVAYGGYGDGGYYDNGVNIVENTDKLVDGYHFNESLDADHYENYLDFDSNRDIASNKAMPLARLDISYSRKGIYFGIIGESVFGDDNGGGVVGGGGGTGSGQPLPGGLPFALIAGLFGFGFCYVRRRKVIAD